MDMRRPILILEPTQAIIIIHSLPGVTIDDYRSDSTKIFSNLSMLSVDGCSSRSRSRISLRTTKPAV